MTSRLPDSNSWHSAHPTPEPFVLSNHTADDSESLLSVEAGLRELILEYCRQVDAEPVDDLRQSNNGLPISVYLPDNYEPNYAYPLVTWLHGDDGNEDDIQLLMPLVSDRNYVGLAIRAPWESWNESRFADTTEFENDLHDTVCRIRRQIHIHSERIYLAGFGSGATMAMRMLLNRPDWFAGVAMMGGELPEAPYPFANLQGLRNKRVFWTAGETDPSIDGQATGHALRMLHVAGLQTTIRTFDGGHQIVSGMLDGLNHWIMQGISSATFV